MTESGVQAFRYRGAERVSTGGRTLVIHPDELHDGHATEAAGFAYRMLYIDPMLVRSALGECAVTPFVPDVVAEDPALAAVLAEAFETFPGALDPLAVPAVIGGLSDALAPLRPQNRPVASPRRQRCRKACACLSRHCDREFGDRGGFGTRNWYRPLQPRSQLPRANRYFAASLSNRPVSPSGSRRDRRRACSCRGRRRRRLRRSKPYGAALQSPLRHYPGPIREIAEKWSNGSTRVVKPTVASAPPMPALTPMGH